MMKQGHSCYHTLNSKIVTNAYEPISGHKVGGGDAANGANLLDQSLWAVTSWITDISHIFISATITHHSNALHGKQHYKRLADIPTSNVPTVLTKPPAYISEWHSYIVHDATLHVNWPCISSLRVRCIDSPIHVIHTPKNMCLVSPPTCIHQHAEALQWGWHRPLARLIVALESRTRWLCPAYPI